MGNTISIGELRKNPTPMIRQVKTGEVYTLTDHGEPVADIVPHHHDGWRPLSEAAAALRRLGVDPAWAAEFHAQRLELASENPWENPA